MNKIISHLDLDLSSANDYKIVNAQQLDNDSRRLIINLYHEGKRYDLSGVTKTELQGSRGDGKTIKTPITYSGNDIIIDFDDTILGAKGACRLKVVLFNDDTILSSFPFIIRVDENVYDESGVIASPVYSELEKTLGRVDVLEETVTNNETIRNNNENTRKESELERVLNEKVRNDAESSRLSAEKKRITDENTRISNEDTRIDSETKRIKSESDRISAENDRITNESTRKSNETFRVNAENTRKENETSRTIAENNRNEAETKRATAESNRTSAEETRIDNENTRKESEQTRVTNETNRIAAENVRTTEFDDIKTKFTTISFEAENMNVEAISSSDTYQVKITNKSGESTTSPNLLSKIEIGNVETEMYDQEASASITGKFGNQKLNLKLPVGKPFKIKKSYKSITDMNANIATDLELGEFCIINTGNVEDEDNAKLYIRDENGASFLTDLSGAQGIQGVKGDTGNTPNIEIGTVNTGEPDTEVSVTLSGTKEDPILNFTIPKGSKGDKGDPGKDGKDATTSIATTSSDGLMSSSDKTKLDGIEKGANKTIVDTELSSTSTNPVQNKVVQASIANKSNIGHTHTKDEITDFPTSYSWDEIDGKPEVFPPESHTHDYLPLSGGTVTGATTVNDKLTVKASSGIELKNSYTYPAKIYVLDKSLRIVSIGGTGNTSTWGTGLEFSTCSSGILPIYQSTSIQTSNGNGTNLGSASRKFGTIYCEQTSSDRKEKKDVERLKDCSLSDKYLSLFEIIDFVKFRWKNNQNGGLETPPSSRYHYGIIAQDIEKQLIDSGIGTYDNGIIKSTFFAENTSGAFITGGYQPRFENEENGITYDYSENVYNYKHGKEYEIYNEIVEKNLSEIDSTGVYKNRRNISYLMIEDNSKLDEKNNRPPVTINGVILVDKDGNTKKLDLDYDNCISYYEWDDTEMSNPKTSGTLNDNGSITVSFDKKYGTYMIKVDEFDFYDYEKIILDVDYVGEYKVYLIPTATERHVNANVWDRGRIDDIMLIYNVEYQELEIMCLYALQQKTKNQENEIENLKNQIKELKGLIDNA